ncbi:hypothetical protein BZA70DRAFT_24666 [Myxozyma melibiosi]|uniref:Uncharacterized protein n=1 Tax=Myxozyma melibiosi TaxID=54550 RepID=A0ABR1FD51_9ASCO
MPKRRVNSNTLTKHYVAVNSNVSARQQQYTEREEKSVNELIQESRARALAQSLNNLNLGGGPSTVAVAAVVAARGMGAEPVTDSLSAYLADPDAMAESSVAVAQIPETQTHADELIPQATIQPRRRPIRRTFAGPPPPATWIAQEQVSFAAIPGRRVKQRVYGKQTHPASTAMVQLWSDRQAAEFSAFRNERNVLKRNLPGAPLSAMASLLPREGSLAHWCLVRLARDWDTNVDYLYYYLPDLEPTTKMVLVAYLGLDSPNGIGSRGFRLLFDPNLTKEDNDNQSHSDDPNGEYDSDDLEIDDSNDRITTLDLTFQIDDARLAFLQKFMAPKENRSPSTSWQRALPSTRAFPFLSALSLSHPSYNSPTKLWSSLLSLIRQQPTLVALSLANWPIPPEMFYSQPDAPAQTYPPTSPVATLRAISRTSFSLKWVDFSYCTWLDATAVLSFEWTGGWRNMKTLVLRGLSSEETDKIEKAIVDARQGLGNASIEVVTS